MSELAVSSRDALARVLGHFPRLNESRNLGYYRTEVACSCGGTFWFGAHAGDPSATDAWGGHLADALLASGVVRVLPDEETVAQTIQDAFDQASMAGVADRRVPGGRERAAARAVLALFEGGSK